MKAHILNFFKNIISPKYWVQILLKIKVGIPHTIRATYMVASFFMLLVTFLFGKIYGMFMRIPLLGIPFRKLHGLWRIRFYQIYEVMVNGIEKTRTTQLKRSYLISLAYKNLMVKKTRSFITILGMSVGVGIIVLLLSLGYGLEKLIISKVAGLDELKIIDVSTGENTSLRLNSDAVKKLKKLPQIEQVVPFISLVGRVSYNKANTDTLVYAVPKQYLEINKVRLLKGKYFAFNQLYTPPPDGQVAGVETKMQNGELGGKIRSVEFNIKPTIASLVWESCSISSKILGYTSRLEGGFEGEEVWGGEYAPFENKGREGFDSIRNMYLGLWVRAHVPLFEKNADGGFTPILDELGRHKWETVCLQSKDLQILSRLEFAEVLGESTESAALEISPAEATASALTYDAVVIATSAGGLEVVQLQSSDEASLVKKKSDVLKLDTPLSGETVVSLGFLRLLNIPEKQAVGKTFKVSFIVVKNLMPEIEGRVLTSQVEYTIRGVVDDVDAQYMYVPFTDAQTIGIKNFSQVKVVFTDKDKMSKSRKAIETMGFKTNSTADTVSQIETLFANLRLLLGLLGMVALGVASLGMFNTLTVSLLERTREIGGMKTMGVVSDEIQDLFLAEAMIMGLGGGVGGLMLGEFIGRSLSFGISLIAIVNGQGYLSLTYVPPFLVFFILLSSFIVGMITGFYPAQRAKKISALNALRYE